MAVTVANYGNTLAVDDCEDASLWTGESPADVLDFYKEGTQCIGFTISEASQADVYRTGSWDLSGKHLRLWFMTTAVKELDIEANDGLQIYLDDGTNTGYYTVLGGDTYPGGWYNIVLDCDRTPDGGSQPTLTAITTIGLRFNVLDRAKNAQNTWIDMIHCCDGLSVYGDDAGGYFDFEELYTADSDTANAWGVIRKISGVYYLNGMLRIGDGAGVNGTKFQAKSQVVIFEDRPVDSALYDFDIVDNGTGVTEFILGDKSGTKGIQGCTIRVEDGAQTPKFSLDAKTDTDVDNFKLYATAFYGGSTFEFPATASNVEVVGCSFELCGQVDPNSCDVRDSFFINTTNVDSALLWNENIDIEDCFFIANTIGAGIEMPSAVGTPYTYTNLVFSGNTNDVLNSSGSTITISKTGTSDPTSYEGTLVTFVGASITVYVKALDTDGVEVQNARVFLKAKDGTGPFPFEDTVTISNSGTTATVTHTAHGMQNNDYVSIDLSASGYEKSHYQNDGVFQITYISSTQYSYTMLSAPGSSPSGTIKATFVALTGLTDVNGEKSTTRVYPSDQPVEGWVRKTPNYKTSKLFGTVDDILGYTATGVLVND